MVFCGVALTVAVTAALLVTDFSEPTVNICEWFKDPLQSLSQNPVFWVYSRKTAMLFHSLQPNGRL